MKESKVDVMTPRKRYSLSVAVKDGEPEEPGEKVYAGETDYSEEAEVYEVLLSADLNKAAQLQADGTLARIFQSVSMRSQSHTNTDSSYSLVTKMLVLILLGILTVCLLPVWLAIHAIALGFFTDITSRSMKMVKKFTVPIPLLYAALSGSQQMVDFVLQNGCSPEDEDDNGNNVFHWLVYTSQQMPSTTAHMHNYLVEAIGQPAANKLVTALNKTAYSPLETAVHLGSAEIVKAIMDSEGVIMTNRVQTASYRRSWYDVTTYHSIDSQSFHRHPLNYLASRNLLNMEMDSVKQIMEHGAFSKWIDKKIRSYQSLSWFLQLLSAWYTVWYFLDCLDRNESLHHLGRITAYSVELAQELSNNNCTDSNKLVRWRGVVYDSIIFELTFMAFPMLIASIVLMLIQILSMFSHYYNCQKGVNTKHSLIMIFSKPIPGSYLVNSLDILRAYCFILCFVFNVSTAEMFRKGGTGEELQSIVFFAGIMCNLLAALFLFRAVPIVSPFVLTLRDLFRDLASILLAFVVTFFAFAIAFMRIYGDVVNCNDNSPYGTLAKSLYQCFLLMNGVSDFYLDKEQLEIKLLYVSFSVVVIIILLNLIIGVMGNTTHKVFEKASFLLTQERLNMALGAERVVR